MLKAKILTSKPMFKVKIANLSIHATDIENYKGAYTVTPSSEDQILVTKNKRMIDNVTVEAVPPIKLQEKEVNPSKSAQYVKPDLGYDGLSQVTVKEIPSEYIVPYGIKHITENGQYNVRAYENVIVNVQNGIVLPSLSNPAEKNKVFAGEEYIDQYGNKQTGEFTIDQELSQQEVVIDLIKTALKNRGADI
jgi:hypothetical protein